MEIITDIIYYGTKLAQIAVLGGIHLGADRAGIERPFLLTLLRHDGDRRRPCEMRAPPVSIVFRFSGGFSGGAKGGYSLLLEKCSKSAG